MRLDISLEVKRNIQIVCLFILKKKDDHSKIGNAIARFVLVLDKNCHAWWAIAAQLVSGLSELQTTVPSDPDSGKGTQGHNQTPPRNISMVVLELGNVICWT